jgi:hypothetical protein
MELLHLPHGIINCSRFSGIFITIVTHIFLHHFLIPCQFGHARPVCLLLLIICRIKRLMLLFPTRYTRAIYLSFIFQEIQTNISRMSWIKNLLFLANQFLMIMLNCSSKYCLRLRSLYRFGWSLRSLNGLLFRQFSIIQIQNETSWIRLDWFWSLLRLIILRVESRLMKLWLDCIS